VQPQVGLPGHINERFKRIHDAATGCSGGADDEERASARRGVGANTLPQRVHVDGESFRRRNLGKRVGSQAGHLADLDERMVALAGQIDHRARVQTCDAPPLAGGEAVRKRHDNRRQIGLETAGREIGEGRFSVEP
jgi:hypothetical protein